MKDRAKELFLMYGGNRFYMDHDGVGSEYDMYHISKETEAVWAEEYIRGFFRSEMRGREALRAYSTVAEFMNRSSWDDWNRCLYHPLRAGHLDDVTILFMLPCSFRMAERAAKKGMLSRDESVAYIQELDRYSQEVTARAEAGTITRAEDYVMQEFSDPVYVAGYLNDLRKKWDGLAGCRRPV